MRFTFDSSKEFVLIAGPCALSGPHHPEVYELQNEFFEKTQGLLTGFRVVGFKSRTAPDSEGILAQLQGLDDYTLLHLKDFDPDLDAKAKNYYGLDVCEIMVSQRMLLSGTPLGSDELPDLPSVLKAKALQQSDPSLLMATEIIEPTIQIPQLQKHLRPGSLLAWTPSNDALGPPKFIYRSLLSEDHLVAIKNPKWLGMDPAKITQANVLNLPGIKTMLGCMRWAGADILIHRGFELESSTAHRAAPVHAIFAHLKHLKPDLTYFFDPSNSLGKAKRDDIVQEAFSAVVEHAYRGLLMEASTATTDTQQHVSTNEVLHLIDRLNSVGYRIKRMS